MSAETLRKAASLMRPRAEVVPANSPWGVSSSRTSHRVVDRSRPGIAMAVADVFPSGGSEHQRQMAEHIASWHPAVALAVADWLEATAARMDLKHNHGWRGSRQALAVARAFLGES